MDKLTDQDLIKDFNNLQLEIENRKRKRDELEQIEISKNIINKKSKIEEELTNFEEMLKKKEEEKKKAYKEDNKKREAEHKKREVEADTKELKYWEPKSKFDIIKFKNKKINELTLELITCKKELKNTAHELWDRTHCHVCCCRLGECICD